MQSQDSSSTGRAFGLHQEDAFMAFSPWKYTWKVQRNCSEGEVIMLCVLLLG